MYQRVLSHMKAGRCLAGTCFWMLAAPSYADYDGFTIRFPSDISSEVLEHAREVARLNGPAPAAAPALYCAPPPDSAPGAGSAERSRSCTCS